MLKILASAPTWGIWKKKHSLVHLCWKSSFWVWQGKYSHACMYVCMYVCGFAHLFCTPTPPTQSSPFFNPPSKLQWFLSSIYGRFLTLNKNLLWLLFYAFKLVLNPHGPCFNLDICFALFYTGRILYEI